MSADLRSVVLCKIATEVLADSYSHRLIFLQCTNFTYTRITQLLLLVMTEILVCCLFQGIADCIISFVLHVSDTEVALDWQYCYPATSLILAYKQRRTELANIHR